MKINMIAFAIFCIQIFFVQYAISQTVAPPAGINNGLPPGFGPNINSMTAQAIAGQNIGLPGPNIGLAGPGLAGQMLAGGMPGQGYGPIGPQALGLAPNQQLNQMGMAGIAGNPFPAGYAGNYGGSGSGDVAVAGELPVAGTTAISGQVPMTGKVQFTGTIPAGGMVTITGQCGCGCNGPYNAPYGAKPSYSNMPYLY